jgi:hypothetical protein
MEAMTRTGDGRYEYRGRTIRRDDTVRPGYWGRWNVWPGGHGFTTLSEARAYIRECDRRETR